MAEGRTARIKVNPTRVRKQMPLPVQIEDLRADKDNDEVRINLMRILKNKCDFKHNLNVLRENRGMLRDHS